MKVLRDNPNISVGKIYKIVADEYGTTYKRVEANIRAALQGAKSDFRVQEKVLGTNRELTNREFLATLAEVVRMKLTEVV